MSEAELDARRTINKEQSQRCQLVDEMTPANIPYRCTRIFPKDREARRGNLQVNIAGAMESSQLYP